MTLFDFQPQTRRASQVRNRDLDQYFTPQWAAQALVDELFGDLSADDLVLEPTCGRGAWLQAIPEHVPAMGIEIDPELAAEAQANTGRPVICGDFREVELPEQPSVVLGNPPYKVDLVNQLLERAREWLPDNGRCGLLLPVYMIQTPRTVLRWNEHWSLSHRLIPRTLFPLAIRPLIFLMFCKDRVRRMYGFSLYREADEIGRLARPAQLILINGRPRRSCWRAVVEWALRASGGEAPLRKLYDLIEPNRPTDNRWWQEKVRQTLQRHCVPRGNGIWALAEGGCT